MKKMGFHGISSDRVYAKGIVYCEHIVTEKCNFHCSYCNRLCAGDDLSFNGIISLFDKIAGCKFYHITGGEPTTRSDIVDIVKEANSRFDMVRMSTNGSAPKKVYQDIVDAGCKSFAISLDRGQEMFNHVVDIIKFLSDYDVQIGTVEADSDMIKFIYSLGVSDIKIGTASQNKTSIVDVDVLPTTPIMKYRIDRFRRGLGMRGTLISDRCYLCETDITIKGNKHYPCAVYMREGGNAIGDMSDDFMQERKDWSIRHNTKNDTICSKYCMDFKCDFNGECMNETIC